MAEASVDLLVGETLIDLALHDALLLMLQLPGTWYRVLVLLYWSATCIIPAPGTVPGRLWYLIQVWWYLVPCPAESGNDFGKFWISRHQENAVGKKNDWNGIMHTSKEHQRSWFQKKNIFWPSPHPSLVGPPMCKIVVGNWKWEKMVNY